MHLFPADSFVPPRPTWLAQCLIRASIREGDLTLDATAGNGHDTVFLAECVGADGRVLAFDVQAEAIAAARARVAGADLAARVEFFEESHAMMDARAAPESVAVVMFNLGYLPGANHQVTTVTEGTLMGLDCATRLLTPGGLLSVICYPGHTGGEQEAAAVEQWFSRHAAGGWRVARYGSLGTRQPSPYLLLGAKPADA